MADENGHAHELTQEVTTSVKSATIKSNFAESFAGCQISNTSLYKKSYERKCISGFMSTTDVLKVLNIALAVGD